MVYDRFLLVKAEHEKSFYIFRPLILCLCWLNRKDVALIDGICDVRQSSIHLLDRDVEHDLPNSIDSWLDGLVSVLQLTHLNAFYFVG